MNIIGILFAVVNIALMLCLPRKWAHLPFLLGALYMTVGQTVEIGPFNFTVMRLLIAAGVVRIFARREYFSGGLQLIDYLMLCWAAWVVLSSAFHAPFAAMLVSHLGLTYDIFGIYFLMRAFMQSAEDFLQVTKSLLILLVPLALEMIFEKQTGIDIFSAVLGGLSEQSEIREGKIRARGPFGHPILAGTAGAVCLPLAIYFWRKNRRLSVVGIIASSTIVIASASSGPLLTTLTALGGLYMWKFRQYLSAVRWAALAGLIALNFIMHDPVYYLMAKIDLVGGSTGWHRAALIESSIQHLNEWWFAGTDYTRHWMPTGIPANEQHTDITNYYLVMGVIGGLPLTLLFVCVLHAGFKTIGRAMRANRHKPLEEQYLMWTMGAILFAHVITFMSIPYFDQTVVLLYFLLAGIATLKVMQTAPAPARTAPLSNPACGLRHCQS